MIDPDLAEAIDNVHRVLLADAAADETDPVIAAGWAWLRDKGKWPAREEPYGWDWQSGETSSTFDDSGSLPAAILQRMSGWDTSAHVKPVPVYRTSPSACLAAAARAVGEWLLAQEAAAPPDAPCEVCKGQKKALWNVGPYDSSWNDCEACNGTGKAKGVTT